MKKTINLALVAFVAICFYSCSTTYYQVLSTKSANETISGKSSLYVDQNIEVVYDFWSKNGKVTFAINNKCDSPVYVDMQNSFFVLNGIAYDYYLDRTFVEEGTVPGYYPETKQSIERKEKALICIPPHTSKIFSEYNLISKIYRECGLALYPTKESERFHYNPETSPIKFKNIIAYKTDNGSDVLVTNEFYVDEIFNAPDKLFTKSETVDKECEGTKYEYQVYKTKYYNPYAAPFRFYVKYNKTNYDKY